MLSVNDRSLIGYQSHSLPLPQGFVGKNFRYTRLNRPDNNGNSHPKNQKKHFIHHTPYSIVSLIINLFIFLIIQFHRENYTFHLTQLVTLFLVRSIYIPHHINHPVALLVQHNI